MRKLFAALLCAVVMAGANAADAPPAAQDPALERRVMDLAVELRCLVCQNQSIGDSQAELAVDLRNQIREQMKAGRNESQIIDYMVARYGDFILYRPPVKATTMFLWGGPLLLFVLGLGLLVYRIRRRRADEEPQLTAEERARATQILNETRENTP